MDFTDNDNVSLIDFGLAVIHKRKGLTRIN